MSSTRKRGRPPVEGKTKEHWELYQRINERVGHLSINAACQVVARKFYPGRTWQSLKQTFLELKKTRLRQGAEAGSGGYIHGDQYIPASQARKRMLDWHRREAFARELLRRHLAKMN